MCRLRAVGYLIPEYRTGISPWGNTQNTQIKGRYFVGTKIDHQRDHTCMLRPKLIIVLDVMRLVSVKTYTSHLWLPSTESQSLGMPIY